MTESRQAPVGPSTHEDLLAQGIAAAHAGQMKRARLLLTRLVAQEPNHEEAWQCLASLSTNPRQERSYLRQALRVNPRSRRALAGLRKVDARLRQSGYRLASGDVSVEPTALATSSAVQRLRWPRRKWLAIWLVLVVAVSIIAGSLIAGNWETERNGQHSPGYKPGVSGTLAAEAAPTPSIPQLVASQMSKLTHMWETRNWQSAAELLAELTRVDAHYPGLRAAKCDTHLQWAREQFSLGRVREAYDLYQNASSFCADVVAVQREMSSAGDYLSGKWKLERQRWTEAATILQSVYDDNPTHGETHSLLYVSYLSWSKEAFASGQLREAHLACSAALELEPENQEAQNLLNSITELLTPNPTPIPASPSGKKIEVNISRQRMYVWQGDTLVYEWVCSTGEPGRGTAAGQYSVLDKIPEAWASTWGLRMPYWLGIYWAGSLENGIHALPINRSGQMLWAGYLGTPVSFGCVILSTENARTLYNWAEIGTPVWIHY